MNLRRLKLVHRILTDINDGNYNFVERQHATNYSPREFDIDAWCTHCLSLSGEVVNMHDNGETRRACAMGLVAFDNEAIKDGFRHNPLRNVPYFNGNWGWRAVAEYIRCPKLEAHYFFSKQFYKKEHVTLDDVVVRIRYQIALEERRLVRRIKLLNRFMEWRDK